MADIDQAIRFGFEEKLSGEMATVTRSHAERLSRYLQADPSGATVPGGFWDSLHGETEKLLAVYLLLTWSASATRHGWEGSEMESRGRSWAAGRAADVTQKFVAHSQSMLDTAVGEWSNRLEPPTQAEIDERLKKMFGPSRVESLAVTEISNAVTDGSEDAMDFQGLLTLEDEWVCDEFDEVDEATICEKCRPFHHQPRTVWSGQYPKGPPLHPRCRCWIVYFNDQGEPLNFLGRRGTQLAGKRQRINAA